MSVSRLQLTNFRSYAEAVVSPGPGFVVLTGENGAGKTNLLEAVSMLAPGRGLRGAKLSEMAREDGEGGFAVAAQLDVTAPSPPRGEGWEEGISERSPDRSHSPSPNPLPKGERALIDLGTGTSPSAPERRQVRINGASASATALGEWLSVLWLTPAMDRLFADTPGARRRFLDRLVLALDPGHARHVARYEAAMRARNRLLADEAPLDEPWCAALETQMAEHGAALAEARERTLVALNAVMADAPEGPFARAGLALEGWDARTDLGAALAAGRPRDRAAGRSLTGPHRSDLAVTHFAKHRPAAGSSTGEQKALLLSIVLAHTDLVADRLGRRPILLLDEVAAHLDPARRAALFERLALGGGQVWMTGTEPDLFAGIGPGSCHFNVAPGRIAPV